MCILFIWLGIFQWCVSFPAGIYVSVIISLTKYSSTTINTHFLHAGWWPCSRWEPCSLSEPELRWQSPRFSDPYTLLDTDLHKECSWACWEENNDEEQNCNKKVTQTYTLRQDGVWHEDADTFYCVLNRRKTETVPWKTDLKPWIV